MPLAPGQLVNARYRVIRLLGQGGFGAVYHAWDINLDRPCALKENLETAEKTRRQFEREARILANLSHPNLPRVTDHFFIPDQGQYLVMDFVDGEDLEERLRRLGRPLDEAEALGWIEQVCEALRYLHRHDPPIIHRDIKPANIRITPQGRAMLVDFGIAKMLNPQARTTIGARAITPGYSPPEQYGQGATDERSDIFAVGATLYTLLTGTVPPDSVDVMAGNLPATPPVERINPHVSPGTSQAIRQAMCLTRSERYQNAEALSKALRGEPGVVAKTMVVAPTPGIIGAGVGAGNAAAPAEIGGKAQVFSGSLPAHPSPSVVVPLSRASSKSRSSRKQPIAAMAFMGLGGFGLALLGGVAVMWIILQVVQSQSGGLATATVLAGGSLPGISVPTSPPTNTPVPSPTQPDLPSETPTIAPRSGAILAGLPEARIAFVSDHNGDGKDQIYVGALAGGEFWFSRAGGADAFELDPANTRSPYDNLIKVPEGDDHDLAWWPDWCDGNSVLVFEAQDTRDRSFQSIYQVDYDADGPGVPEIITWKGTRQIGVPRCANSSRRAIASALDASGNNNWRLYSFELDRPNEPELIGDDGFPFSGFASWAASDRWIAFMHSTNGLPFELYTMDWELPGEFVRIPAPQGMSTTRFPAISPLDGSLAYACSEGETWGLCLHNLDENTFSYLMKDLGPVKAVERGLKPAISGVTPSWSPDGQWLAYASNKDGDWDIYLYHVVLKINFNMTEKLNGDQFHPVWSKP